MVALYELLVLCGIAGFTVYDIQKRQVSDQALLLFIPLALLSPFIRAFPFWRPVILLLYIAEVLGGAAVGFLILLTAALLSQNGTGIGGGDIKLAAVMGFIYGSVRMLQILLLASCMASITAFAVSRRKPGLPCSLPFVPYLMAGSLAVTAALLLQ